MKNNFQIFCLFLLIFSYKAEGLGICGDGSVIPSKAEDCKDELLTDDQKKEDRKHCCYKEEENNESDGKKCVSLTTRQYEHIGKVIKLLEEDYEYKIKIDCNSSYLKFYLLSLIFFFI